jgi:HAD superfamily hydrolase (TIGR01509 family)
VALRPWEANLSRFAAVIFDMDGVLVDGEPLHFRAVNQLLAEDGREITLDQYKPYMGTKAGWREFVADLGLPHPVEHYSARYDEVILEQYRSEAEALPGALAVVGAIREAGIPLALCSSSRRSWVDAALERIGLAGQFVTITTGSDVTDGKPAPDIYLAAAAAIGKPPEQCLAIEDAPAGIQSAKAAGMTCWAVLTEYTRDLELPNPDAVFETLEHINLDEIVGVRT